MKTFKQWISENVGAPSHVLEGPPVPLKPGEKHCPYCRGYGYLPPDKNDRTSSMGIQRCHGCGGSGKSVSD